MMPMPTGSPHHQQMPQPFVPMQSRQLSSSGLNPAASAFPFPAPTAMGGTSPRFHPASLQSGGLSPGGFGSDAGMSHSPGAVSPAEGPWGRPPLSPQPYPGTPGASAPVGFANSPGAGTPGMRGGRRGRGPPQNQPFKISGHNSKPSVSLAPAAFAAALAAAGVDGAKPKRKMLVQLPKEGGDAVDAEQAASNAATQAQNDGAEEEVIEAKAEAARAGALLRAAWRRREPLALSAEEWKKVHERQAEEAALPADCTLSRMAWPEPETVYTSIDIYLPGNVAWDEYREQRLEEKLQELGASMEPAALQPPWLVEPADDASMDAVVYDASAVSNAASFSHGSPLTAPPQISTPADPTLVSDRLSSYLQSQASDPQDPPTAPPVPPFGRFSDFLPAGLRKAAAEKLVKSSSSPAHGQTMSLSVPHSGQPFGPSALDAMGLSKSAERAASDTEQDDAPALGDRPEMQRGLSESALQTSSSAAASAEPADGPEDAKSSAAWKALGAGFGYDIAEDDEANSDAQSESERQANGQGDVDMRTNPSEDGDMSEDDALAEDTSYDDQGADGADYYGEEGEDESIGSLDSLTDSLTPSDEEFSNPSDEEAAREARGQRRALRAELRAARLIARDRALAAQRRKHGRSTTNDTLPSSSIGGSMPGSGAWARLTRPDDELASNPSDDEPASRSFAGRHGPLDHVDRTHASGEERLSQDFRFPHEASTGHSQSGSDQGRFAFRPPGTVGRSGLNPGAKEFSFGGRSSQGPMPPQAGGTQPHFRLPSIPHSSFGSSALAGMDRDPALSAAAPAFTPGAFTFTAPGGAPKLGLPAAPGAPDGESARDSQGREKRQRFRDGGEEDAEFDPTYNPALADQLSRPRHSAASIEGPMRDAGSLGPPPFRPAGSGLSTIFQSPLQPGDAQFSQAHGLQPEAPSFLPSWSRSTAAGTAPRRPGIPSFAAAGMPDFVRASDNKAVPIRVPGDGDERSQPQHTADVPRNASDLADLERETGYDDDPERATRRRGGASRRDGFPAGHSHALDIPHPQQARRRSHQRGDSSSSLGASLDRRPTRARREPVSRGYADLGDEDESDSDVSDIIEEIGERVDKALEGWAGKILDEVTIMGQVRPPSHAGYDRRAIIDAIEDTLGDWFDRLKEAALERRSVEGPSSDGADDSSTTVRALSRTASHSALTGHGPLDAQGELDFDFVQEVLDAKIATLKQDLTAAFDTSLPRALAEAAALREQASAAEAARAADAPVPTQPIASVLSDAAAETLCTLLVDRMQPVIEGVEAATSSQRRTELLDALEPLLEQHLDRTQHKAAANREEAGHAFAEEMRSELASRFGQLEEKVLQNREHLRESFEEQLQMTMINSIIPHLETLHPEPLDPEVIAARVTQIVAPMLEDRADRPHAADATPSGPSFSVDDVVDALHPMIASIKSEPIDTDSIVRSIGEVVGRQSLEHIVDLTPVLALLEPVRAHQEELRSMARRMMERQRDAEIQLGDLPSALNAKTEVFLSSAQEQQHLSQSILQRVAELADAVRAAATTLPTASPDRSAEFAMLESRIDRAERDSQEVSEQIVALRAREQDAIERAHAAERSADEALAKVQEKEAARVAAQRKNELLSDHVKVLQEELRVSHEERARERETAAQATAAALARAENASARASKLEQSAADAQERADARVDEAARIERLAQHEAREAAERAAKVEGQLEALEKRLGDQDTKIAALHGVTATQKQKAAQSQQRLAENERKLKELESTSEQLAVANARLVDMERARDDTEGRLREAQGTISEYTDRFLDLEVSVSQPHRRLEQASDTLFRLRRKIWLPCARRSLGATSSTLRSSRSPACRRSSRSAPCTRTPSARSAATAPSTRTPRAAPRITRPTAPGARAP
jgi:hypothetical protein